MPVKAVLSAGVLAGLLISWSAVPASAEQRLVEAAREQDKQAVLALLKQKANVDERQPDGATALHWAVHWDNRELTDLLIRAGAAVNVTNEYGVAPLTLACMNGNVAIVEALLKAGANANAALPSGETTLMTASRTGNAGVVRALLSSGAKVNVQEHVKGQVALMWAAVEGHAEVTQVLLDHGADVHARSTAGFTALLLAARHGALQVSEVLLRAGADVNEATPSGVNALLIATIRGHLEYAEFLLRQGADPNRGPGFNVLHWASGEWPTELTGATNGLIAEDNEWSPLGGLRGPAKLAFVKVLLAFGADPNGRAKLTPSYENRGGGLMAGATPFLMAAYAGDVAVMRVLLAAGADPRITTAAQTTALMFAARLGGGTEHWMAEGNFLEAVKLAVESGGDVNAVNAAGDTALHGAANCGCLTIVEFLLQQGARLNTKNRYGWTPLTLAEGVSNNAPSPATAELLRKMGAEPSPPNIERNIEKAAALLKVRRP